MAQQLEYFALVTNRPETLEAEVNKRLSEGWELQGGISVAAVRPPLDVNAPESEDDEIDDPLFTYGQALTRQKKA